ncbi:hypothetical protein [Pedobacter sandarakinus]|uniref:hypothetical protein n=1 Tax=Pedobacter sandarakinus TaxID=353156 RepID=UPI0022454F8A|nr:hypothetical protein [Pedobacter sandarakinus]MCX2573125.1 hypothetical protein [Pedobacter sandarakinus]
MSNAILNVPKTAPKDIRILYDKYASMLLGFISGVIQDPKKTEEQLVKILTSFVLITQSNSENITSTWLQLRQHALSHLEQLDLASGYIGEENISSSVGKGDDQNYLSAEEKLIFHSVYHQRKSISYLANILGKEEHQIRIQLKSSIDKMRRANGN